MGCGPGNSTQVLADAFPNALRIIGIDSSPEMIEAAKDDPRMGWICDALNLPHLGGRVRCGVFQRLHPVGPDHPGSSGTCSPCSAPAECSRAGSMNYQEPIHRIIGELAASDEWRAELASARIFHTLSQEAYFDILAAEAGQFQMWQITYLHRMPSHEAIMDWYKGTGLRPYLSLLSGERAAAFEQAVREEVATRYPKQGNGEIIFRFPRFFF
ncbi:MAG: methyltransferase domain-containing protein, partial [Bilophila wadsworthia]